MFPDFSVMQAQAAEISCRQKLACYNFYLNCLDHSPGENWDNIIGPALLNEDIPLDFFRQCLFTFVGD